MSDVEKTVIAIQGNPVKREILGAGQDSYVLTWVNTDNEWEAQPASGISGPAGGDLGGTYPDPIVESLTGISNIVSFPATEVGSDLTFLFNTSGNAIITTPAGGSALQGSIVIETSPVSNNVNGNITLNTENTAVGPNGSIYLKVSTSPGSLSDGCGGIYLDSSSQNGTANGGIWLTTTTASIVHTNAPICLDTITGVGDATTSQVGLDNQKTHFNNSGLCFSQIVIVTSAYTVNNGRSTAFDYIICGDTTSSAFTVTLPPSPVTGDTYILKDSIGNAGTNNLTIDGNSINIDGAATYIISNNYGAITVVFNGSIWSILNKV